MEKSSSGYLFIYIIFSYSHTHKHTRSLTTKLIVSMKHSILWIKISPMLYIQRYLQYYSSYWLRIAQCLVALFSKMNTNSTSICMSRNQSLICGGFLAKQFYLIIKWNFIALLTKWQNYSMYFQVKQPFQMTNLSNKVDCGISNEHFALKREFCVALQFECLQNKKQFYAQNQIWLSSCFSDISIRHQLYAVHWNFISLL